MLSQAKTALAVIHLGPVAPTSAKFNLVLNPDLTLV